MTNVITWNLPLWTLRMTRNLLMRLWIKCIHTLLGSQNNENQKFENASLPRPNIFRDIHCLYTPISLNCIHCRKKLLLLKVPSNICAFDVIVYIFKNTMCCSLDKTFRYYYNFCRHDDTDIQ